MVLNKKGIPGKLQNENDSSFSSFSAKNMQKLTLDAAGFEPTTSSTSEIGGFLHTYKMKLEFEHIKAIKKYGKLNPR